MERNDLFTEALPARAIATELARTPESNTSPLEDYVLAVMPADLRAIQEGRMTYSELAAKQGQILEDSRAAVLSNTDERIAALTHLDLLFMLGGYIPTGREREQAPAELLGLIDYQCQRDPRLLPFMTYDMIVNLNAEEFNRTGNIRVFSDGQDGLQERDFYIGHHMAEPYIQKAVDNATQVAEQEALGQSTVAALLDQAAKQLSEVGRYMGRYSLLPNSSFQYFRRYLATYADGTRNASGAFMPTPQLLELALLPPTEEYGVFLNESLKYFPLAAQPDIHLRRTRSAVGNNIVNLVANGDLTLNEDGKVALLKLLDGFINFRMAHLGVVKAKLPDAFSSLESLSRAALGGVASERPILEPEYVGTAGFDVRNVLVNGVVRLLQARQKVERLITGGQDANL